MRTAGIDGAVVGVDQAALLQAADAFGYDRRWVMRLLPYGEAGLVKAVGEQRQRARDQDTDDEENA